MSAAPIFDWLHPDNAAIYAQRAERLARLRGRPEALPPLFAYYRERPASFVSDWGQTLDPRLIEIGRPASVPFVLFPKQVELIEFVLDRWRAQEHGIVEKTRDVGASWVLMALACTLCLFNKDVTVLIVSRTENQLDRSGDPGTLFAKARAFLQHLPSEFLSGWRLDKHSAHLRINFPGTGSAIVGAMGDQSYRGGRASLAIVDEAAFVEKPAMLEAALSAVCNTRIDVSTPNGRNNFFAEKRFSGRVPVFSLPWTCDPRKDQAWYDRQRATLDPVTVAREIDLDYSASTEGLLLRPEWLRSVVGASGKLGLKASGTWYASLDVADEGRDENALAIRHGIELKDLESWSGRNSNIYASTLRAINRCDEYRIRELTFDSTGVGSGCRGDINAINEQRTAAGKAPIADAAFLGAGALIDPDGEMVPSRKNSDFFANRKSQSWWHFRLRCEATHRAVTEGIPIRDADQLISIDPELPQLEQLLSELAQPTYTLNSAGRVVIDKVGDGVKSPNLADATVMLYAPREGDRSAGYFSALIESTSNVATEEPAPPAGVPLPHIVEAIVASVSVGTPPHEDVIATAFFVWTRMLGDTSLLVIDYDVVELNGATFSQVVPNVLARIREWSTKFRRFQNHPAILVDTDGAGVQLHVDACSRGIAATVLLDEHIAALDISSRAVAASGYVLRKLVRIAQPAAQKTQTLRATTKNWLAPILNFSTRQSPELAGPLLAPTINLILDTFVGDKKRELAPKRRT